MRLILEPVKLYDTCMGDIGRVNVTLRCESVQTNAIGVSHKRLAYPYKLLDV